MMTDMVLAEIPIIDFKQFTQGDSGARKTVAKQIDHACHEIGFMYLKNHGISQSIIDDLFGQTKDFFALPLVAKNQLAWSDEFSNRGDVGIAREGLDQDKPGDLKETFNVGKEDYLNQWPKKLDDFQNTVLTF